MFQTPDGTSRMEAGNISPIAGAAEPLTPTPPPPFDQHQAYKFITTAPLRDPSPPPSYDEAIRAMMVMATSTPGDQHQGPVPEPSPQHQSANVTPSIPASLTPQPYPSTTIASSALTPEEESAPVIPTLSALTQPSETALVHPIQPTLTPQLSTALTQISETALTSPIASRKPTQQMEEVL
jgi:hypothetical protein